MEQQMTKHENIFNFLFSLNFFIVRRQYWVCVDILNFTSSLINCLHRLLPPFSQKSSRKVSKKALTTSTNIKVGDKRREAIAIGESMEKQQYTYYTVSLGLNHNKGLGWRSRIYIACTVVYCVKNTEWQRFPLFPFEYFLIKVAQGCGQRARAMKTSEEIDPTVCELRFTVLVKISRSYTENQDHIFHLILEEFLTSDQNMSIGFVRK